MMTSTGNCSLICRLQSESSCVSMKLGILKLPACNCKAKSLGFNITGAEMKTTFVTPVRKTETSTTVHIIGKVRSSHQPGYNSNDEMSGNDFLGFSGIDILPSFKILLYVIFFSVFLRHIISVTANLLWNMRDVTVLDSKLHLVKKFNNEYLTMIWTLNPLSWKSSWCN